jgi:hypothetical protein
MEIENCFTLYLYFTVYKLVLLNAFNNSSILYIFFLLRIIVLK